MDDLAQASAIGLGLGVGLLAVAGVISLLRRTRGLTGTRRVAMIARLIASAPRGLVPPQWLVASMAAGLIAFICTFTAGVTVTVLIIRAIPPDEPNPTEAYEGFGDAVEALFRFFWGSGLSLLAACVVGLYTVTSVARRWGVPCANRKTGRGPGGAGAEGGGE
jgi:hypothetical protein